MTRVSQNRISVFLAVGFAISLLLVEIVDGASLYWTDERGIHRSDLDGQNPRTIVPIPITSIGSMAIDEIDNKIYYADFYGKRILRSNLDGTELENVITSGLWAPISIVVDSSRRKVYWIDQFEIYRANLDGTDIEMLLESWEPSDLAIDEQAGKIYWLYQYTKNPPSLGQANLDGTDEKRVIVWDNENPLAIAINADAQKVYFIRDRAIQRANMDGTDIEVVLELERSDFSRGIAVDPKSGKVFWSEPKMGTLYRANLDGSDVEIIVQQNRVSAMTLHRGSAKVYWADHLLDMTVHRANFDGSGHEVVWQTSPPQFFGIDVDESRGHIYWASVNRWKSEKRGEILRANLDGTAVESIIAKGKEHPEGIAFDELGEKIYWVDTHWLSHKIRKISRANLDGSSPEDLVIDGIGRAGDIEVDIESGKMYWVDGNRGIYHANLDGTVVEVLIGNLDGIYGVGIDQIGEKIYWTDIEGPENTIRMANLNDGDLETLVKQERRSSWYDIDIDNTNQKMYWVNRHKGLIQRANLDGSDVEIVLSDLATPKYIALDLVTKGVVAVEPEGKAIVSWGDIRQNRLLQNYPNPFNPETWIPYQLAEAAEVTMKIYDANGVMVRALELGYQPAGKYDTRNRAAYWDGRNEQEERVASGIYFCTLTAGDFATTQKMSLSK